MATADQIKTAERRGREILAAYPRAISARFDARLACVAVRLSNGHGLLIDPRRIAGLARATDHQLKAIEITAPGLGLYFPRIDVDLYVPALIDDCFLSRTIAASKLGEAGGKAKSKVKAAAARANGRLGGRPGRIVDRKKKRSPG